MDPETWLNVWAMEFQAANLVARVRLGKTATSTGLLPHSRDKQIQMHARDSHRSSYNLRTPEYLSSCQEKLHIHGHLTMRQPYGRGGGGHLHGTISLVYKSRSKPLGDLGSPLHCTRKIVGHHHRTVPFASNRMQTVGRKCPRQLHHGRKGAYMS
jgi:hypothetical protein